MQISIQSFKRGITVAFVAAAYYSVDVNVATADNFLFRRLEGTTDPSMNLSVVASANDDGEIVTDSVFNETLVHLTVNASGADDGASANAIQQGTATALTPINATTFAPTVDTAYLMSGSASGVLSTASASANSNVGVTATFEAEAPEGATEGFLHGFIYIAENGGVLESGVGADADVFAEEGGGTSASIGEYSARGTVNVNEGVKTAGLFVNLPGLTFTDPDIGGYNYLFHFVIPIIDGTSLELGADGADHGATAFVGGGGGTASFQWVFKAASWVYATTSEPSIPANTTELVFGDYNDDGFVDAADYVVWRKTFGQTGADLAADGDGDGTVDDDDYTIWKLTFNSPVTTLPGAGATDPPTPVPEPSSLALSYVNLVVFFVVGRGRRLRRNC